MRVLYCGGTICSPRTLKYLLLLAEEVAFIDRPGLHFGTWGTIGYPSTARRIVLPFGSAVDLSVHEPPTWNDAELYRRYMGTDLANERFIAHVVEGLRTSDSFARKLLQLDANYGQSTGQDVRTALLRVSDSFTADLLSRPFNEALMYECHTKDGCIETMKSLVQEASIAVTSALAVAEQANFVPVSDDPYFARLLDLRTSDQRYVRGDPKHAPKLSLAVAQAVIPEAMIEHLNLADILEYRKESRDAYAAYNTEINRLACELADAKSEDLEVEAQRIVHQTARPKLIEYRNEMQSCRDRLFGDLIKRVTTWELPTLTLASLTGMSWNHAMLAFAGALTPAIPAVVDYLNARREARRQNAMTYLVEAIPNEARYHA